MKIWFDIDGVVSDFVSNAIDVANDLWPGSVPLTYVPQNYNFTEVLREAQWQEIWAKIKTIPNFWLRQRPIYRNVAELSVWMEHTDHELFFITSRKSTGGVGARPQTILWLHQYGLYPENDPPTVIAVESAKDKKKYIEEFRIDMGIDDLPSTVTEVNMLPWHSSYLLSQPWNQECNLTRVNSMAEFLDIVEAS